MVKVEKCLVRMGEWSEGSSGRISIPVGAFEHMKTPPCKFLAVKKEDSDFVKLLPVEDDERVYEVYAEVVYGAISAVITTVASLAKIDKAIKFVPELVGVCPGDKDEKTPCVFNGFVLVKEASKIDAVRSAIARVTKEGKEVVLKLKIEEVA